MFFRTKIVRSPAEAFCASVAAVVVALPAPDQAVTLPAPAKKTRRSRHGEKRTAQLNIRTAPSVKVLAEAIAVKGNVSLADVIASAIVAYAKSQGVK
jgi:hypothetical protein